MPYVLVSTNQPFDKKPCSLEEEGVGPEVLQILNVSVKRRRNYVINETPDDVIQKFAHIGYICLGSTGSTTTRVWTFSKDEEFNIPDAEVVTQLSTDELKDFALPPAKKSTSKPSTSKLTMDAEIKPLFLPSSELVSESSKSKKTKINKKSKYQLKFSLGKGKNSGKRRMKARDEILTKRIKVKDETKDESPLSVDSSDSSYD